MESLKRALTLSRSCGDTDIQCSILTSIAHNKWRMGDAHSAQIHVNEAIRLANVSGNLLEEARALRASAQCATQLGDYPNSIVDLHREKEILGSCGWRNYLYCPIAVEEAEVHVLKSEYTDARRINTQILQHAGQDPYMYACALVNIAEVDVIIGAPEQDVQQNLNEATKIFRIVEDFHGVDCCKGVLAD
jgi:ATP/maltotriose-dependent transcriptional regulator MalT